MHHSRDVGQRRRTTSVAQSIEQDWVSEYSPLLLHRTVQIIVHIASCVYPISCCFNTIEQTASKTMQPRRTYTGIDVGFKERASKGSSTCEK